jgi:hypothetical protein
MLQSEDPVTGSPIWIEGTTAVGTTSTVGSMTSAMNSLLGSGAPVSAFFDQEPIGGNDGNDRDRLLAVFAREIGFVPMK